MWTFAANTDELLPGDALPLFLAGFAVLLINIDGQFYAIEDKCSHMDFPLSDGIITGDEITCIHHGARFCIKTGAVTAPPACDAIKVFPVNIEEGRIFVDL